MPLGNSLERQEPSAKVIGNKQQDISLYKYVFYCLNSGVVSLLSMERQNQTFYNSRGCLLLLHM